MISSASATLVASGFSHRTCAPLPNASRQMALCALGGAQTITTSGLVAATSSPSVVKVGKAYFAPTAAHGGPHDAASTVLFDHHAGASGLGIAAAYVRRAGRQ